jgi:hypothetical protein
MIPGSANPLLAYQVAAQTAYQISRSLRFDSASTSHLSRTIASAGNRRTFTWSAWIKRCGISALNIPFSSGADQNNNFRLSFSAADQLQISNEVATNTISYRITTAVYRDTSAWMHVVVAVDTTQATAANRVKLYVNGDEVTQFSTNTNPGLNFDTNCNVVGTFYYGRNFQSTYFDGYLADAHFISGSALTPSSFGQVDATTGQWIPIAYTGSYGTNGHKLTFANNSAATAAALGADSSGAGNNFTPVNMSVTAGVDNDSLVDSPTGYGTDSGAGGEVRGNYCTFWPAVSSIIPSDGNLSATLGNNDNAYGDFAMASGKWYWEVVSSSLGASVSLSGGGNLSSDQNVGSGTPRGFRLDVDANLFEYTSNGTSWSSINMGSAVAPFFIRVAGTSINQRTVTANFGQRPFNFTAPTGYKALCSENLPTPAVAKSSTAMNVVTYTGTGATLSPTSSLAFSPDLVWIKSRSSSTSNHAIYDSVRGATLEIASNLSDAQTTQASGLTSFDSNGFTVGSAGTVNTSSQTYVAWCWDAGTSTTTNTTGSISSQVRANTSAGFSIVTYTGTGSAGNVGHGLGVTPAMIAIKCRSSVGDWRVWHKDLTGGTYYVQFNSGVAQALDSNGMTALPTSSVFTLGTSTQVNFNSATNVAYCFAAVSGFSRFGSYTGNGSAAGPTLHLGFRPRFVMTKNISATGNWLMFDTSRLGYNPDNDSLVANSTAADSTTDFIELYSNGLGIRSANAAVNTSNSTYIYAAFAEYPFKYARAR